jgi:hypothetical protein
MAPVSLLRDIAPVGQTSRQRGFSQCWQLIGTNISFLYTQNVLIRAFPKLKDFSLAKEQLSEHCLHPTHFSGSNNIIFFINGFRFSFDLDEKVMRVGFLDLIKNPVF